MLFECFNQRLNDCAGGIALVRIFTVKKHVKQDKQEATNLYLCHSDCWVKKNILHR